MYGPTTSYGSSTSTASLVTSHSLSISGLSSSTIYHFAVVSTNAEALTSTSSDQTFSTTTNPPVISNISANATTTSATITWTTDQSSASEVVYGTTTDYGSASSSASNVTSHGVTLTGLTASTTYDYEAVSTNTSSQTSTSTNQTFTTASPLDTTPPSAPGSFAADAVSSDEVDLSWSASTDNVGVANYELYRDSSLIASPTGTTYSDLGLSASTTYSYAIVAVDTSGNVSASSTASATTEGSVEDGSINVVDQFGTDWHTQRIGGGGYVIGMDIAADGTKIVRTDTYGAYLWDGTMWKQLVTSQSMPADIVGVQNNAGVYEIRIAPNNTNRFYMMYLGNMYRTDNQGASWTLLSSFATTTAAANDNYRMNGEKMAVDPVNENVVYVGSESTGLWQSLDGGATWTNITNVGTSSQGITGIAFDPSGGTTGGKTNIIYASPRGGGVWESTDAGNTWTKITSSSGPSQVETRKSPTAFITQSTAPRHGNTAAAPGPIWIPRAAGTPSRLIQQMERTSSSPATAALSLI